jgi:UDP-glucose 4-epimerase
MRIHVTGGRGFLGGYITPVLGLAHEVEVSDRKTLDVTDINAVRRALEESRPESVVHLAALCGATPSIEQPHEFFRVNAQGAVNVLEACRQTGVNSVLLMSSLTVHGQGDQAMREDSPYAPRHPYAAAKVAAEMAAQTYARCFGMQVIIMRPTLVVGEGYKEPHAIGDFVETARRGAVVRLYGGGLHRRDFVHPEDVARAVASAVEILSKSPPGSCERLNVSNGDAITMADLARLVVERVGRGSTLVTSVTGQAFSLFTSIDRAKTILNWQPQIGVEEIISRLARHSA